MARGLQKIQSQKKNEESKGKQKGSQLKAREQAMRFTCPECKCQVATHGNLKMHMESKHPGAPIPPE
ncbi:MAG: hypothetical protein EZS28_014104 [Streblomastix strix]|uniref:C2H2-type domain-containing protein n=1 Tax=Streblomastix strix TaxID=222440 RepID=A0A5J4W698_9EUKA|nr:MAG: hypothetical protein EZS28_014104 [Streblomastix strix]